MTSMWELTPGFLVFVVIVFVLMSSRKRVVEDVLSGGLGGSNSLTMPNGRLSEEGDAVSIDSDDLAGTVHTWRWTVSIDQVFTSSSPASMYLIGYSPTELIGQPVGLVMDAAELQRADQLVNETGGLRAHMPKMVVTGRHRDGSASWFEVELQPRFDAEGEIIDLVGNSRMIGPDSSAVMALQQTRHRIETLIANRLLMTAFQPIVDLVSGEVLGVEALTRFISEPDMGPDRWFAAAASVGLGTDLELLAIQTALTSAIDLPAHLYVSLNVSPATCLTKEFADLMADSPFEAVRIVLELTEHRRVDDYVPLNAVLNGLRANAVRIAVDDAGAGFASLQHILQLRPDIIKLDRCIISGIDGDHTRQALAGAVVAFARHIDARVVAEGVETKGESRTAREIGILGGQGYLFGRPSVAPKSWREWRAHPVPEPLEGPSVEEAVPGRELLANTGQVAEIRTAELVSRSAPDFVDEAGRSVQGHASEQLQMAMILDAMPDATALLDHQGRITSTNAAWRMFALDNGGTPEDTGVGVNYLDVCRRSADGGSDDALQIANGLRSVLDGETIEVDREYSCHSPDFDRWFITRITSIGAPLGGAIASHVNITRRKRLEQEFAHQATHDPLTGLANRMMFANTLAESMTRSSARAGGPDTGVIYIDLDDFKPINDRFGHSAGDEVLQTVASRLLLGTRPQDTVSRLGGDEFAICFPRVGRTELKMIAGRIGDLLDEVHQIHGQQIRVGGSIGTHLPVFGESVTEAIGHADRDMYAVKGLRRALAAPAESGPVTTRGRR